MRILKDRKITLHGAHISHLGSSVIFLLASAYASDKICRKTFFDTLNTLVQRAGPRNRYLQKLRHLVMRAFPDVDAKKIPLSGDLFDNWTVAGIFSGITDSSDFQLLQNPEKKGEFFKRHFEPSSIEPKQGTSDYPFRNWDPNKILLDTRDTFRTRGFRSEIESACDYLERGIQSKFYDAPMHIRLRIAAASLKEDHHLDIIGPFASTEDMERTFADIFHIAEPDFDAEDFDDYENFNFEEPAVPPPKSRPRQAGGGRVVEEDQEIDNDSTADYMTEQDELVRDIQQVTKDMLKRAGINHDVQIPAERISAQLGFGAAGAAEGKRRDANGSRPPSCVIV